MQYYAPAKRVHLRYTPSLFHATRVSIVYPEVSAAQTHSRPFIPVGRSKAFSLHDLGVVHVTLHVKGVSEILCEVKLDPSLLAVL